MAITGVPSGIIAPAPAQQTLASNYIDFTSGTNDWAQQYLPDLMEKEAEIFGNRTISGFLSQVGAEESMTADQVVWSEQGRLHLSYTATVVGVGDGNGTLAITADIDGDATVGSTTSRTHAIRVNDTVLIAQAGAVVKALVVETPDSNVVSVEPYAAATLTAAGLTDAAATVLVIGSEYGKGQSYSDITGTFSSDRREAITPTFKHFDNKPIIMKDYYEVSGSDASQVGWVEVSGEEGQSGYMWYLKAEGDTRARFTDYLEMSMIEAEKTVANSAIGFANKQIRGAADSGAGGSGTEGLFAAIEARGNLTSGVTGVNAATDLAEFDAILAEFDKNGAIEENMMFVNRATSLAMDDMLASMNSYGAGGTSYGVFDNSEDMALNLGFSGFRRGSYDFYKSDFRYLNDKATRGGINDIAGSAAVRGVIIPAGVSSVYDQQLGKNLKRPFLHVRYRASQTDDRRMKTWVTGSVGATTSALDAMQVHYLSERCLIVQGANNFMLMN
ncbi:hypothetical protein N9C94_00645 [Candidatus Pelagibacter sp.]|nr:hypothetical protein [Candidatus Pelagibacter sp.]